MTQIKELAEHLTNTMFIQVPRFTIYTFKYRDWNDNAKYVRIQSTPFVKRAKIKNYKDAEQQMKKDYPNVNFHLSSMLESFETKTIEIKLIEK